MSKKLKENVKIAMLNDSLDREIKELINKKAIKVLDWSKIHRAKGRFGTEFKVEGINDKEVRIYNSTQDNIWDINIVLPVFDFFYDDGRLASAMEND